jgi:hypothetical protein
MKGSGPDPKPKPRGTVPPRATLPQTAWKTPPRTAAELGHGAVYTLEPDEVMVYASVFMDTWYLVGQERTFSVDEDGTVAEITEGAEHAAPLTLESFRPEFRYMRRCPIHGVLDDWGHREVCGDDH